MSIFDTPGKGEKKEDTDSVYDTYLNMINSGMDFDENIDQYLEKEFLTYICENDEKADLIFLGKQKSEKTFLKYCTASGSTIPGMPNIILVTNSDNIGNAVAKIFKFSPTDYFIYPTHKQSQT